jgi:aryl-alcohol dehydrogenase-like predicted oxidoreductase
MLIGFATPEGTSRYCQRFPMLRQAGNFRQHSNVPGAGELWLSSIGLGTYLGEPDAAADARYTEAIGEALRSGINVLDTAINYRHQRSERNIGEAIRQAVSSGAVQRDEILVCTKAGYLSFDGEPPPDPREYFTREYIEKGILDARELAGGMHCMSPVYIEDQIERSRRNLGLETIDVFYVHNPETQFSAVDRPTFRKRLAEAFELLERLVSEEKIRYYGAATWNGFRVKPDVRDYLSLADMVKVAREAGGEQHHMRFIQLPYNLAMLEAYAYSNQGTISPESTMQLAARSGVMVVGSATIYQGQLAAGLPDFVREHVGMDTDAANAIQFARSTPGVAVSLIGMSKREHVQQNLALAAHPLMMEESFQQLFRREER